jgi:RNA polymerase sigma factor (sigma-70 family)
MAWTDEQLLDQLRQGRTEALDELYRRYARPLFVFFRYSLRIHDPEDLVHDVFLRVVDAAGQFDSRKASFRTWLFRIGRNRCIDVLRRGKREAWVPLTGPTPENDPRPGPTPEETVADPGRGAAEACLKNELHQALRECIDGLENPEDRQALILYYLADQVFREIARALGKSLSMARKRLLAAREKVRHCLENKGIGSGEVEVE